MLLWLCFALLTAAVVALLMQPLRRGPSAGVAPAAADLAVYRDQLRELDAERDRGLIADDEIESARAEIARRLLKRAGADAAAPAAAEPDEAKSVSRARKAYAAIAAVFPVAAIALYLATGSPQLSSRPFAGGSETAAGQPSAVIALIAQVEQRLREHPEDGKGWDVIAPVYLRLQRYGDAAHAFAEANRLEGESVRRLLGFAEATLLAENGIVTEPVRKAALRVLELEPARKEIRAWLILAQEQDGDLAGAAAEYRKLLDEAPADAVWRGPVAARLALVEKKLRGEKVDEEAAEGASETPAPQASAPAQAPTAPQGEMPDIAAMSPADREAFITSMVDRLATRLNDNGHDLDGWMRLARAYKVLGRDDDARGAFRSARTNFAGDQAALAEIDKSEQSLGLKAEEPQTPQ
jgi:cytochrome c-type biogenesis protein CcmH